MPNRTRITESPRGVGKVVEDSKPLLQNVRYELQVTQEMIDSGLGSEIPGMSRIDGRVYGDTLNLIKLMNSQSLVLHMQDGRKLPFFFKSSDGQILARGAFQQ